MSDFANRLTVVPERLQLYTNMATSDVGEIWGQPWNQGSSMTANLALYIPLRLPYRYPLGRIFWANGSTAVGNNIDVGIYTIGGGKIWTLGGVAQNTIKTVQFASVGIILSPGAYFLAISSDGSANVVGAPGDTFFRGRAAGFYQQAAAYPLPATATFAAFAYAGVMPALGITTSTSGA